MNQINYQKELDKLLADNTNKGKKLLLHSCCAPCSSYVLTYLSSFFDITVFYYNPNITFEEEYKHRVEEQKRLINELNELKTARAWSAVKDGGIYPIKIIDGDYDSSLFFNTVKGYEDEREGGARCAKCFRLRLECTYEKAKEINADYFGTTLTISPLKNAQVINSIGKSITSLANEIDVDNGGITGNIPMWLPSDFKKKEGYKHSIELSAEFNLYRQNYCGCVFSKNNT